MAMPESTRSPRRRPPSVHRALLSSEAGGGIALMVAAAAALAMANSGLASAYFATLHAYLGPLSILHWINDALMPVFFLMVGLEIKREFIDGHLSTWPRRILPGLAASGGMIAPAVIYVGLNAGTLETLRGWGHPDGD
jgi:Na+:H+ antiporter, NhaA family